MICAASEKPKPVGDVDGDDDDAGDAAEPVILDKELFLGVVQSKYADFFPRSNPPGQRPRCSGLSGRSLVAVVCV